MQEVVVTGVGVVTSHAENAGGFLNAVTKGISGIRKSGILSQYGYATEYCGLIDKDPSERWEEKFHRIGTQAIRELLDDAQIRPDEIRSLGSRTAYFLASASLGSLRMERLLKKRATQGEDLYEEKALDGNSSDCCFYFKEQLGIQGPVFKVDVACASGMVAIGEAVQLIQAGAADLCVSSGIDVLNDLTLSGFNSMNNMDPEPCRPFDQSHNGITIGEGAGFVLLESLQHAKERGAKIYGRITGYVSGNDAYHVTAPDPSGDGAFYCMNEVLRQWGKTPEQIYINTHGTATRQNDEMEMLAIERLVKEFGFSRLVFSSTKSMIGHTLGSSGMLEFIASLLCMGKNVAPVSISVATPMEYDTSRMYLHTDPEERIFYDGFLSNSFAFAGNSACIGAEIYREA